MSGLTRTWRSARIRAAALKENVWPAAIGEFLLSMRSEIMIPAPFSPLITPGKTGPYFEIRTYTYAPGALPGIMKNWERALPDRVKLSPLCLVCYSELGGLNKWVHIWPYATLDQRNQVRDQSKTLGIRPPSLMAAKEGRKSVPYVAQENKIVMPAAFSPAQQTLPRPFAAASRREGTPVSIDADDTVGILYDIYPEPISLSIYQYHSINYHRDPSVPLQAPCHCRNYLQLRQ